jgi:hypothetical protein
VLRAARLTLCLHIVAALASAYQFAQPIGSSWAFGAATLVCLECLVALPISAAVVSAASLTASVACLIVSAIALATAGCYSIWHVIVSQNPNLPRGFIQIVAGLLGTGALVGLPALVCFWIHFLRMVVRDRCSVPALRGA